MKNLALLLSLSLSLSLLLSPTAKAAVNDKISDDYQKHLVGKGRDPFSVSSEIHKTVDVRPPLERFDLNEFRLVSIMWGQRAPRAVVKDPFDNQHTIKINDRIGHNNGFVAVIKEDEIVVVERSKGHVVKSRRVLRLR